MKNSKIGFFYEKNAKYLHVKNQAISKFSRKNSKINNETKIENNLYNSKHLFFLNY